MKKHWLMMLVILFVMLLAGCQAAATPQPTDAPTQPPALPEPTAAEADSGEVVLTLTGLDGRAKEFTMAQLKQLPATEGYAGIKTSTGKITPPSLYTGVLLTDLIKEMGAIDENVGIQIEAVDGYAMTFSASQLTKGNFITYDPATGDEIQDAGLLQVLVAYAMNGEALDAVRDGVLRLAVISEKNNQVTDGHWAVKWVNKVEIKEMAREWSIILEGATTETLDRGSFESCSTALCHVTSFQDDQAQTWSGTPLWRIVGLVDDEDRHSDDAFNRDLAAAGYTVEVIAKDGFSATFDSARLVENNDILVANLVNENPLSDEDFPLRLVGADVQRREGVGAIDRIVIRFGEQPASEPTAAPTTPPVSAEPPVLPEGKAFMATGLVASEITWTRDELEGLDVVKLTVEHPKKGAMEVEGVRFSTLLPLMKVKPEAKSVTFTAADGFAATASLQDLQNCADCLLQFDAGSLLLAMPGMPGNLWVKDVVAITLH